MVKSPEIWQGTYYRYLDKSINVHICVFAHFACLLLCRLALHFPVKPALPRCSFYSPQFTTICYCSSIYYTLIGCCMLRLLLFAVQISNTGCVHLSFFFCHLGILLSVCWLRVFPHQRHMHTSCSASLELWAWKIILDLLEKNAMLILMFFLWRHGSQGHSFSLRFGLLASKPAF